MQDGKVQNSAPSPSCSRDGEGTSVWSKKQGTPKSHRVGRSTQKSALVYLFFCPEGGDLGSDLNCSQLPGSSFLGQSSILALLPGVLRSRSLSPSRAVHRDKLFLAPVGKAPPQIPPLSFLTELTLPSPRHRTLNDPTRISPPILILGRSLPSS